VIQQQVIAVGTPQSFRTALARSLEVEPDEIGWVQSVTAAEEILVETDTVAHVLVLSPEVKEPDALGLAEFVGRAAPMTAIIMVRDKAWNGLLPAAMRAGIRDVVDLTQGSEELRDAVERAILWSENVSQLRGQLAGKPKQRGTVISVFASKGGVGKTFLTTNLAAALADISKQDTAVADLDVDMGDVFSYFGREPTKAMYDLIALGEGADRETVFANATKLDEHLWGFGAIPDPSVQPPGGEAVGKYLRVLRTNFAYVVVDASADYTDLALACFDLSDAICLVTALDVVGVKHLSKALETLLTIGLPRERFRIVLNRADSRVGLDAADVERVMKIQVDTMIPSSRLVPTCLNKGRPVVMEEPNSEVSDSIRRLATRFVGSPKPREGELMLMPSAAQGKRKLFKRT
jgi:pilus assembly protein CpaE